ncbi:MULTISPECIES: DUF5518 domain-containing protein [Salinibaculum]|uniref:DUF5518 domain-containing protein n=1 Tax=Salinibaculum TaxID=2732368 RepID=UPI0030CDB841
MNQNPPSDQVTTDADSLVAFDRLLDWGIGGLLGIVGLLATLAGVALYYGTDRPDIATLIHNSEFQSEVLTEAEAIDAVVALGQWTGIGLGVAGVLTVGIGIAVVVAHGRARQDGRGTPRWILGVVGAIVGVVLGFVPFSPVIGGAAAGYLDPDRTASGVGTGTLAGLFATLPVLVVAVFAGAGLFVGLPGDVAGIVAVVLAVGVLISLAYLVVLSVLGGYFGGWLRKRQ